MVRPKRGDAAEVGIGSGLILGWPIAVHPDLGRPAGGRHGGRGQVQDVDAGIARKRGGRIHHPEEPAGLEIEVPDLAVLRLTRGLTHGVDSLGDLASLLGGRQRLELKRVLPRTWR